MGRAARVDTASALGTTAPGTGRRERSRYARRGCGCVSTAVAAAEPVRARQANTAVGDGRLPGERQPTRSLRHWHRGQRGGREEHDVTSATGAPVAMADPSESGPGHDRRLPATTA